MFSKSQFPVLLSLLACGVLTSCAHAQDEPDDADGADTTATTAAKPVAKPALKAPKRAQPKTFQVKAGAIQGGDGSAQKPFGTLQEAIDAAQGGDTIVIGAGTYEGGVSVNKSFPDDAPLTIRASDGTQPVLSGMKLVTGWKAGKNGIYSTEVEGKAKNLFVGAERLSLASWPKIDGNWIKVSGINPATKSLAFSSAAPPVLSPSTRIYAFSPTRKNFEFVSFQKLAMEEQSGSLSFDEASFKAVQSGKYNKLTFFNSPSFISQGDEYAMEYLENGKTKFYFQPRDAKELAATQYRAGGSGIYFTSGAANVRIMGLVITGMNGAGIGSNKAKGITIEDCVLYNNDSGFNARTVQNLTLRRCYIAQNYWGVGLFDVDHVTMQQCEVAFNDEDGIRVSGRIFDKSSKKLGAADLNFSQLYVHHHQYQGHPDNIQFFRGVGRVQFDKCLLMYGGQQMMMEQTEDMELRDSVVLIGINRGLNLFSYGNPDAKGWSLQNNTIGYNRYNPVYVGGVNNSSRANLYFNFSQPVQYTPTGLQADHDWFSPTNGNASLIVDKQAKFSTANDFGSKGATEANGRQGDPKMRNVPDAMAVAFGGGSSSPTSLSFENDAASTFAIGDLIEINGDGIARKVQKVEGKTITFSPALPAAPFRYSNVLNWKNNPNFQIDTRPVTGSPVLTAGQDGKSVGSSLDVAAYQKGDFDGDGKRDLPAIPQDLAAMLRDRPNRYIYPYSF